MSCKSMLKWPGLTAAFFAASLLCLATPVRAGLLLSRTESPSSLSRTDLERELVTSALVAAGWSRSAAAERIARLTDPEIRRMAEAGLRAAGEDGDGQNERAFRVGLAIVIVLAFFTGIYLFADAD